MAKKHRGYGAPHTPMPAPAAAEPGEAPSANREALEARQDAGPSILVEAPVGEPAPVERAPAEPRPAWVDRVCANEAEAATEYRIVSGTWLDGRLRRTAKPGVATANEIRRHGHSLHRLLRAGVIVPVAEEQKES